jgi:ribosomal protein L15
MMEDLEKANPYRDGSTGRFTTGGGGGAGGSSGGGSKGAKSKKLDSLAIDLFNHQQSMPQAVRTGKKTPAATAWRTEFSQIVDQAASVLGVEPREAYRELQSRMGVVG